MNDNFFQNIKSDKTLPFIENSNYGTPIYDNFYEIPVYNDNIKKIIININIKNKENFPVEIYINI